MLGVLAGVGLGTSKEKHSPLTYISENGRSTCDAVKLHVMSFCRDGTRNSAALSWLQIPCPRLRPRDSSLHFHPYARILQLCLRKPSRQSTAALKCKEEELERWYQSTPRATRL